MTVVVVGGRDVQDRPRPRLLPAFDRLGEVRAPGAEGLDQRRVLVQHGAELAEVGRHRNRLQAQQLIRSFRVTVEDNGAKYETPVFVGVSTDRTGEKCENPYRLAEDVAKSADLQAVAEADALEQLRPVKARYDHLKRLGDIWAAIDGHGGAVRS